MICYRLSALFKKFRKFYRKLLIPCVLIFTLFFGLNPFNLSVDVVYFKNHQFPLILSRIFPNEVEYFLIILKSQHSFLLLLSSIFPIIKISNMHYIKFIALNVNACVHAVIGKIRIFAILKQCPSQIKRYKGVKMSDTIFLSSYIMAIYIKSAIHWI